METSKCLDSASQDITISPLPKPQIFGDSTLCFNVVGIYNAVDTAARKLVWGSKYGKILFGLRQDTVYVHYASAGKDMLKVIETNSVGCRDSVFRNVIIHPVPDANWKTNIDSSHNSNIFAADDSTFSTYIWNFGDGSAAYSNKTSHSYNHADTFNVSLKVYDNFSCSSEKDSTIVVSLFTGLQNIIGTDASLNIYPNPFKDKLIIQYSLVKDTRVSISMEDIFGKQIISLDDKYAQQGNYSMILDTEKYHIAPGIYFLKILLDGKATSKKIVKVD